MFEDRLIMKQRRLPSWAKVLLLLAGVILVALLASIQMAGQFCLLEDKEIRQIRFLPINLAYFLTWGLLFFPIQKLSHVLLSRFRKWQWVAALQLVSGAFFCLLHLTAVYGLLHLGTGMGLVPAGWDNRLMTLAYRWTASNIYIYIAMVGLFHFFYYFRRHREKELKASQLETQVMEAQLQSLRMQLQPHFLFNALNTISGYVKKHPDTAIRMIARLSELLRLTLESKAHLEIPLKEELKITTLYLELEQLRFSDRLKVNYHIAPETQEAMVPAVLLQPLAENAVRHGISRTIGPGIIAISAVKQEGNLVLKVEDNGPGQGEPRNNHGRPVSNGIGLRNLRERLTTRYGAGAQVDIEPDGDPGFTVTVTIPFTAPGGTCEGR